MMTPKGAYIKKFPVLVLSINTDEYKPCLKSPLGASVSSRSIEGVLNQKVCKLPTQTINLNSLSLRTLCYTFIF